LRGFGKKISRACAWPVRRRHRLDSPIFSRRAGLHVWTAQRLTHTKFAAREKTQRLFSPRHVLTCLLTMSSGLRIAGYRHRISYAGKAGLPLGRYMAQVAGKTLGRVFGRSRPETSPTDQRHLNAMRAFKAPPYDDDRPRSAGEWLHRPAPCAERAKHVTRRSGCRPPRRPESQRR